MSLLESLKWRAAIKKFDTSKKVSDEDVEKLLEAGNLAATSGGLQPFKMVVVKNEDLQTKLIGSSYNQRQVADASHLLVFAVEAKIDGGIVDRYIERAAELRGQEKESLIGYSNSMKAYVESMDDTNRFYWAKSQAYIALGTVLAAAADLRIDSCPMEGMIPDQYVEILGLKSEGLVPVVVLPIGYRSDEDVHSKEAKIRKSRENFVVEVN